MRTSCIAQGTLLSALWWPKWEEIKKKQKTKNRLCVYIWLIHFVVQQKLTQHCKAIIILQFKKKAK